MVKFKFWVSCKGWKAGGYENAHFAETEDQAKKIVERWNEQDRERVEKYGCDPCPVTLLEIIPITDEEFAEDYIPPYL